MNLGNLTLEDFIKAGWSAADVKDILQLSTAEPAEPIPTQTEPIINQSETTIEPVETQTEPETKKPATINEEFQKEIEKMRAELTQAKQDLATAQAENRNKNFSDTMQSDDDIFTDFVKSY